MGFTSNLRAGATPSSRARRGRNRAKPLNAASPGAHHGEVLGRARLEGTNYPPFGQGRTGRHDHPLGASSVPAGIRSQAGGRARTGRAASMHRSSRARNEAGVIGASPSRITASCPRARAAASACCISAAPIPSSRQAGSTASGPRTRAGLPPALTCHSRTVPTSVPSRTADSARPAAGARPSRRRWQVRSWRFRQSRHPAALHGRRRRQHAPHGSRTERHSR